MPLSASTITRQIDEIAEDIETHVSERINESSWYTIQVDNKATMIVFVQDIFEKDVHEIILCALLLLTNITTIELFKSLHDYTSGKLKLVILCWYMHGWSRCHNWTAFWFHYSGQRDGSECESMHCVIHREMLASQKMSPEPNILQDVIKTVNHLKVYALNSRLFVQL